MSMMRWDVIIVGGGHAGTEAAAAAARYGAKVALVTHQWASVGTMSCNPAIGGLGKGHLVREIDALDGLMGRAIDAAGIHFKVLNSSKGPAVRGPRAQADRDLYRDSIQSFLAAEKRITVIEGEVVDLHMRLASLAGVILKDGRTLLAGSVVLTTGTFLRGIIHRGETQISGGRVDEAAAECLSERLLATGLKLGRLKTGTPPRLNARTINWEKCETQFGDSIPEPFSTLTKKITNPQIACGITRTNPETHAIIRDNLHRSAIYSGNISGRGPRYCPSIEDKVVRFADRDSHQIFLEPEGLQSDLIYPNGISTSLPEEVQLQLVRSIAGLERADIVRSGYAIEYDYVDPRQLEPSLELKAIPRLFLAGQINGTTGYEEAGAQGLIAGLNAARCASGAELISLARTDSYIGVMIDDLTRLGVTEPYRMFTSRAEFRLSLRADNAEQRLTECGIRFGCVSAERMAAFEERSDVLRRFDRLLSAISVTPQMAESVGIQVNRDGQRRDGHGLLSLPQVDFAALEPLCPELAECPAWAAALLETDARYRVYLDRQQREIAQIERDRTLRIPPNFDFEAELGLSAEIRGRLAAAQPRSLAEVATLEGITPSALVLLAARIGRSVPNDSAAKQLV